MVRRLRFSLHSILDPIPWLASSVAVSLLSESLILPLTRFVFSSERKIRCIGHKPNPCEICVKRGFICSYDWISRRGKRKPKNQDGTPMEIPGGSVSAGSPESQRQDPQPQNGHAPATPLQDAGPAPPPVGLHPTPGMHPNMHMGQMSGMPGGDKYVVMSYLAPWNGR